MRVAPFSVVLLFLVAAPTALATPGLQVSVSSDPTIGKAMTFTASGTAGPPDANGGTTDSVWTVVRPASDGPCAADFFSDPSQRDQSAIAGTEKDVPANTAF